VRRFWLPYLLIPAVLIATAGLAYYSLRLQARERGLILETIRELAEEKAVGIQTSIEESEGELFKTVGNGGLEDIPTLMKNVPVVSVLVFDLNDQIVPGGHHTKRNRVGFRELFASEFLPLLNLDTVSDEPQHLHVVHEGAPYLFAVARRTILGRPHNVVLEFDLPYLVSTVFPQFFNVRSKSLYQVIDEGGELVYGFPFQEVPTDEIVGVPFANTLTRWSLRAVRKDAKTDEARRQQKASIDGLLIGLALLVIVSGVAGLVGVVRRERRLNQLKSDFIANVSHELKTPLSIISMFGELLALGRVKSEDQAREYADIVRRESVRLSRLIDNVLDFAKIERGANVYEFSEGVNFAEVVEKAVEISRPRLERESMELVTQYADSLPALTIDTNAMTLAILNLLDNGIKYAKDGKRVEVTLEREGDGVLLTVKDFGDGIPAGEEQQIFERFYRAREVRSQPIRGSGIGLALVRDVVSAHGGRVSVDSSDGEGACFSLWLPVKASLQ